MDRQQANALVGALAEALNIPALALDDRGTATVGIGEEPVIVSLGYNAQAGAIDLMVCLDDIEPSNIQITMLLGANFGWLGTEGATFACVPGSGAIVLQRRCTEEQLRACGLAQQVQNIADLAQAWSQRLAWQASSSMSTLNPDHLAMASGGIILR